MISDPSKLIERKLSLAKAALFWEDLWGRAFPAVMVAGLFVLTVLLGLMRHLPGYGRLALVGLFAAPLAWFLRSLFGLHWPTDAEALKRIETVSGLKHRPATAFRDKMAAPQGDPRSQAIWAEHRARMARKLGSLSAGTPRSPLPERDPMALRNALALALIAAIVLSAGQWDSRVAEALSTGPAARSSVGLDAWIAPPAYTSRPPVLLTGAAAALRMAEGGEALVPEGSKLVVRVNGGKAPRVVFSKLDEDNAPAEPLDTHALAAAGQGIFESKIDLTRPVHAAVEDESGTLAAWRITIIPDAAPKAQITDKISVTPTGSFAVPWKASDDYGVASLVGRFTLAEAEGQDAAELMTSPLVGESPDFPIALNKLNPTQADGRAFQDLTAHPWAGLEVDLTLKATDQAGQTGVSAPVRFKLPERQFSKLLARAVVEQRKALIHRPAEPRPVVRALSALMAWPEGLIDQSGVYLGLRQAATLLYQSNSTETVKSVSDLLWQIALVIEDGNLSEALKELDALRKELQQALAEGAPPEKIAELMQKLREALDKYLEAMRRQMMENMQKGALQQMQPMQPGEEIRSQDLQRMLDMIENLAKSGAMDAAQEMLSQLENILKNLQPGMNGQMSQQNMPPMARMLQELGEMMRRQQQLMDDTFRMPEGMQGQPGQEPGSEPGMRGSGRQPGQQGEGLAGQQEALGKMLEEFMRQLGQQGLDSPQGLGKAQESMGDATGALREGERGQALGSQNEAMQGLREGAQAMAKELMQQGTGNEGNYGRHGEARGDDRDPLGRPMPQRGEDYGPERDMLPTEAAVERARQILELLRNRANEPNRPKLELDYLDRLLRGLY